MNNFNQEEFSILKGLFIKEKKIIMEMGRLLEKAKEVSSEEKFLIDQQMKDLETSLKSCILKINSRLKKIELKRPLPTKNPDPQEMKKIVGVVKKEKIYTPTNFDLSEEKTSLEKMWGKKEKKKIFHKKKPSSYVAYANKLFGDTSIKILEKGHFRTLVRDLSQSKMRILPKSYISVILLTGTISFVLSLFIAIFFLFFNLSFLVPFIVPAKESLLLRFGKVFWIVILAPLGVFTFTYFYPSMEKKSMGGRIDGELPFATIHMSAISGSSIEPSKIFSILISTGEYPHLQKELVSLVNEMNVFGHDLVTSLRNVAFRSPSRKLTDLFNGLATTITSGGNLATFFEKRAESYLFDYRLEREKYTKMAETFMDIYISVVIASPLILMLLLMMMKVSGFGISLSMSAITLVMIAGVCVVNIGFLVFLSLKQPVT
jgi:hypothetical protein